MKKNGWWLLKNCGDIINLFIILLFYSLLNMKKYILTALLWVFGLCTAFASADTVDWFTSDSEIYTESISDTYVYFWWLTIDSDDFYFCISTDSIPYYFTSPLHNSSEITNSIYCLSSPEDFWDESIVFYSDSEYTTEKEISWTFYYSESPITYSSSSGGGSSSSDSPLLSGWTTQLSPIINGLSSAINEFIPYIVYLGLWIIVAIIGFVAIKRLINRTSAKVRGTFKSWKRRR